jgi:Tfp pilus assembly protein PilX
MRNHDETRRERGVALVVAMMVLLGISLLALILMFNVNIDRKIAGHSMRSQQALNLAEAGVNEACSRLANDVTLADSRAVARIFLANPGSVPVLGTDSVGYATSQPNGAWLQYSTATNGSDALTIQYRTDAARTTVYKYDDLHVPKVNTVSGMPIYRITSTGRVGSAKSRVVAEVIQKPTIANVQAAIMAGVPINFGGNCAVCGYNHRGDTPAGVRPPATCVPYHTSNNLPAAWSTSTITSGGSASTAGSPVSLSPGHAGLFFAGPWEPLSMSQADFWAWVGARHSTEPSPPVGIIYLDDNVTAQDAHGNFAYHGGDGRGFLYVDGDMTINGNFTYRGLIYIEGDLKINGTCWILGGLVVKGKTSVNIANGNMTILYSSDAITQNISQSGSQYIRLSWREVAPQ